ncbi:DUF805 domain-containing protein [Acinetobacter sp. ANC 4648]|uniref:DUF805 domain-containing protein n=1 Tax=Acinetobacter sp. ANC 4648 TaxID=1977875 RepID=UPI000A32CE17|nr:DUF805 domain-containing protein [Acinetobacter sp. ANC 4648]OTG83887.1 hypothetical protein B9T27_05150 [Acinetobacter sp. ANC 4648]
MKGVILDYSIQTNSGVISGDDQHRYSFTGVEWKDQKPPTVGARVDFAIDDSGHALQIYTTSGHNNSFQNISKQLDQISDPNKHEEQFNPIDWFVKCLKNYTNFSGRARRKEFWFFVLIQFIILVIAQIIDSILHLKMVIYSIAALALFIPSLAVGVRRLHDINRSGWWYLIAFIPLIGAIFLIIWWATDTKQENNQWGNPAK